jgi:hypothetical protein
MSRQLQISSLVSALALVSLCLTVAVDKARAAETGIADTAWEQAE